MIFFSILSFNIWFIRNWYSCFFFFFNFIFIGLSQSCAHGFGVSGLTRVDLIIFNEFFSLLFLMIFFLIPLFNTLLFDKLGFIILFSLFLTELPCYHNRFINFACYPEWARVSFFFVDFFINLFIFTVFFNHFI